MKLALIAAGVLCAAIIVGVMLFAVPTHFSLGSPSDLWQISAREYAYWNRKGLPRDEITGVTVLSAGDYAIADANIDTDNISLYRRRAGGWERGASLTTGAYCELIAAGVPTGVAYRLSWSARLSIGAGVYRRSNCPR